MIACFDLLTGTKRKPPGLLRTCSDVGKRKWEIMELKIISDQPSKMQSDSLLHLTMHRTALNFEFAEVESSCSGESLV